MTTHHLRPTRLAAIARLRSVSDSPALDADMLLGAALGLSRAELLANPSRPLSSDEHARFAALLERAAAGEPIAYILGTRAFYNLDLVVTPDVLIPRPETELLLERALAWANIWQVQHPSQSLTAADIGTGSGALAVTFSYNMPNSRVHAVELSPSALAVARLNAERAGVGDRIIFHEGDLLAPLLATNVRVDLLMANLPYIPPADVPGLAVSRYEPALALDGGNNGLALIRQLLADAPRVLQPHSLTLLEIQHDQGERVAALAAAAMPSAYVSVHLDYAGLDRIVQIEHSPTSGEHLLNI